MASDIETYHRLIEAAATLPETCEWLDESWGPNEGCREFMAEPEVWSCHETPRWYVAFSAGYGETVELKVCARHAAQALATDTDCIDVWLAHTRKEA